mmetsp:Transcript_15907/g.37801  ORF Transcript_15907/g.37801 Transcript_15907/m.37801 type:complete len:237 (+) Transcript_15907:2019-2729(+)
MAASLLGLLHIGVGFTPEEVAVVAPAARVVGGRQRREHSIVAHADLRCSNAHQGIEDLRCVVEGGKDLGAFVQVVVFREYAGHSRVHLYDKHCPYDARDAGQGGDEANRPPELVDEPREATDMRVGFCTSSALLGVDLQAACGHGFVHPPAWQLAPSAPILIYQKQRHVDEAQQYPNHHHAETHEEAELSQGLQDRGQVCEEGQGRGHGSGQGRLASMDQRPCQSATIIRLPMLGV